jgi:hypothetical protein
MKLKTQAPLVQIYSSLRAAGLIFPGYCFLLENNEKLSNHKPIRRYNFNEMPTVDIMVPMSPQTPKFLLSLYSAPICIGSTNAFTPRRLASHLLFGL